MPVAEINIIAGRTPAQRTVLLAAVRKAILSSLRVERGALSVWLREFPRDHVLAPEDEGEKWMTIRITCFSGRTSEIKRGLYTSLAEHLSEVGEDPRKCVMTVVEEPLENWGILGGNSAADMLRRC